uniref:F-box domain-containing protein n=1 Tax=Macrostomum lignano TaxID=282301 RepID=A0A1I8GR73_9PLAT
MHQPESLTAICCRFIGPHLHQVDSLAFVPEHLGLDMLQRFCSATAVEQLENRSCDPDDRLVSVCRLMDQAFSDSFCTCLCLDFIQVEPGSPLCNRLLLVLPLMRWLRRVSIRGVRLWDQHPLVPVIAANRRYERHSPLLNWQVLCGKPDAAACCAEFRVKFAMCAAGRLPGAAECQCWATACGIVPRVVVSAIRTALLATAKK